MGRMRELNFKIQYYGADGIYQIGNPNGVYHMVPGKILFWVVIYFFR